jgi:hypothetical protein
MVKRLQQAKPTIENKGLESYECINVGTQPPTVTVEVYEPKANCKAVHVLSQAQRH